ncbi:DsbA family oxidoreductase [Paracoccus sp. 1_MG-2023]|uniref:DsbA family oxidoreductase n=1 Tax=unclassified Paracoccus (in: a-proteobacteria) TaxID=2688777 RepID=UPI001C09C13D|nr:MULTISPECIES: DsbA family oxidoreductase [unclassified Paracoccus (in: a-proteobacteria)]MBU2957811.1 DsbA family oxidoreductase [Paracoccus sp. C2R09]MDO6667341.1 DsbA family oxidoreductase [Paracoccus sp. 1_MG-2023]
MTEATPIRVDIVSDVVCPWCVIGYRQLARASEETGIPVDIHWHPFELNSHMPPEGQNLREHIAEKYGTSIEESEASRHRLTDLGAELGFEFNYAADMRMVNTFRAHQLIDWAATQGKAHEVKMALFASFFTDRRDVSQLDVLGDAAVEAGLDRDEALAVLQDERMADDVRQKQQFWTGHGISGVPAMVFMQQHLVTGAQGTENYGRILRHLAEA